MIQLDDIKKAMPILKETWKELGPDGRKRWQWRDIWQSVFLERETMISMLDIINNLKGVEDMTVVDLGCEAGLISVILAQKFKHVIAIDLDETSIERTHQTLYTFWDLGWDISNIEVVHGDFNHYFKENKDSINAVYKVDSHASKIAFYRDHTYVLENTDMIIISEKEDFKEPIEEREEYLNKIRGIIKTYGFTIEEHQSLSYNRTPDVFILRK